MNIGKEEFIMIKKYGQGNRANYDMHKWLVEEESELAQIPRCQMGSSAYVITTGETWMMDSKGSWHVMGSIEKDPIACDCVEELTIWSELPDPSKI